MCAQTKGHAKHVMHLSLCRQVTLKLSMSGNFLISQKQGFDSKFPKASRKNIC